MPGQHTGQDADHSRSSRPTDKNAHIYTYTPSCVFTSYFIKHRHKFATGRQRRGCIGKLSWIGGDSRQMEGQHSPPWRHYGRGYLKPKRRVANIYTVEPNIWGSWLRREPGYLSRYRDSLWVGRSGDRITVGTRFSTTVQTGPDAHPDSFTVDTWFFREVGGGQNGRGVALTTHPIATRLKKE